MLRICCGDSSPHLLLRGAFGLSHLRDVRKANLHRLSFSSATLPGDKDRLRHGVPNHLVIRLVDQRVNVGRQVRARASLVLGSYGLRGARSEAHSQPGSRRRHTLPTQPVFLNGFTDTTMSPTYEYTISLCGDRARRIMKARGERQKKGTNDWRGAIIG